MSDSDCASSGVAEPVAVSPPYRLNPALQIRPFDSKGRQASWLYELRDARGRVQQHRISEPLHRMLERFHSAHPLEAVLACYVAEGADEAAIARLRDDVLSTCIAGRMLIPVGDAETFAQEQPARPHYMSWMLTLLAPRAVRVIASPFQLLFAPIALAAGVLAILAGFMMLALALSQPHAFGELRSQEVLWVLVMAAGGILLHELGHAAAAQRFGAREVSIGVGWYVCFPVAFAGLSEAWAFPRWQRALVDVAGVYVQGLLMFVFLCAHQVAPHPAWLLASVSLAASMLWNLNPFLRLDGYWLASDLLGIPNLREEARAHLSRAWARFRGRTPVSRSGFVLSARMGGVLVGYAVLSSLFFVWLVWAACAHFGAALIDVLPAYVNRLLGSSWASLGWDDAIVLVGATAWQSLLCVLIGRFLYLTFARWFRQLRGLRAAADA